MSTLHCTLENGGDLYVNEHQKIPLGLLKKEEEEKRRRMPNRDFFFVLCVRKIARYSDVIYSFDWKSAIEHDGGV